MGRASPGALCYGTGSRSGLSEECGEWPGLQQAPSEMHFSEEGQFPWLCASWGCHS